MSNLRITEQAVPSQFFFKGNVSGSLYVRIAGTYYLIVPSGPPCRPGADSKPRLAPSQADDQYVPVSIGSTIEFGVRF
jgi:hypothetical protein